MNIVTNYTGIECFEHEDMLEWGTAFEFFDGDAITFFSEKVGNQIRFFDGQNTVWHLSSVGLELNDKTINNLKNQIKDSGVIYENGDLSYSAPIEHLNDAFSLYLKTLLKISDWEASTVNQQYTSQVMAIEAEAYLKSISQTELQRNVRIDGASGKKHTVHFKQDDSLYFLCNADASNTGATIRKIIDLNLAGNDDNKVIFMDDTKAQAANEESEILLSVAKSVIFKSKIAGSKTIN